MEPNTTNNENNSHTGLIGIILILLLIVIGAGAYLYYNKAEAPVQPEEVITETMASACGINVESPDINQSVSFPVTVTGTIDNTNAEKAGCSWVMFEGQAGLAQLYYETKDGWSLPVDSKPIMVKDWMTTQTDFSVTLNFDNSKEQFPSNYRFKIVLTEEDPSGEGKGDVVEIPVVLK